MFEGGVSSFLCVLSFLFLSARGGQVKFFVLIVQRVWCTLILSIKLADCGQRPPHEVCTNHVIMGSENTTPAPFQERNLDTTGHFYVSTLPAENQFRLATGKTFNDVTIIIEEKGGALPSRHTKHLKDEFPQHIQSINGIESPKLTKQGKIIFYR